MPRNNKISIWLILLLLILEMQGYAQMFPDSSDNFYDQQLTQARELMSDGYYSRSKETYLKAVESMKLRGETQTEVFAYVLMELGDLYGDKGELAISRDLYRHSHDIISQIDGATASSRYKELKLRLGIANAKMGDNLSAMVDFKKVRTLYEKELPYGHPNTISAIISIADVYRDIENWERAESLYEEALLQIDQMDTIDLVLKGHLLLNQSNLFEHANKIDLAVNNHKTAIDLYDQAGIANSMDYAIALADLGRLFLVTGKLDTAQVLLNKASDLLHKSAGSHHSTFINNQISLADLSRVQGDYLTAKNRYEEIIDELLSGYAHLNAAMGIQAKTNHYRLITSLLEKYASMAEYSPELEKEMETRLFDYKLMADHLQLAEPYKITHLKDTLYQRLRDMHERELFLTRHPISEMQGGEMALENHSRATREMEARINEIVGDEVIDFGITREELDAKLDSTEALGLIFRYNFYSKMDIVSPSSRQIHYALLYVDARSPLPKAIVLPDGNELENRYLTHHRNSFKHKFIDNYGYDVYWRPFKDSLGTYKRIILAPSGAYRQINLLTLKNIETGEYLLDEQRIDLVSRVDIQNLDSEVGEPPENPEVYLFGNTLQNFPGKDTLVVSQDDLQMFTSYQAESGMYYMKDKIKEQITWNELLYNDELKTYEVDLVKDLYESAGFSTKVFKGVDSREDVLKKTESPNILHLASHAYFMEDPGANASTYVDNILLHSGLIFSGSFDYLDEIIVEYHENEGLLTTSEIAQLSLDNTELAFLTSCETGIGIVQNGKAIESFQRAFMDAGVKSIIMSMWTTEAEFELEFVNLFYFNWLFEKMTKREAYWQSMKMMKDNYEHPYYWGAFIYIGE